MRSFKIHVAPLMLPLKEQFRQYRGSSPNSVPGINPCQATLAPRPHTLSFVPPKSHDSAGLKFSAVSCGRASVAQSLSGMSMLAEGCSCSQVRACSTQWRQMYLVQLTAVGRTTAACTTECLWGGDSPCIYLQPVLGSSGKRYSEQFNNEWYFLNAFCFVENDEIHGKVSTLPYFNFFKKKPTKQTWSCGNCCLLMITT